MCFKKGVLVPRDPLSSFCLTSSHKICFKRPHPKKHTIQKDTISSRNWSKGGNGWKSKWWRESSPLCGCWKGEGTSAPRLGRAQSPARQHPVPVLSRSLASSKLTLHARGMPLKGTSDGALFPLTARGWLPAVFRVRSEFLPEAYSALVTWCFRALNPVSGRPPCLSAPLPQPHHTSLSNTHLPRTAWPLHWVNLHFNFLPFWVHLLFTCSGNAPCTSSLIMASVTLYYFLKSLLLLAGNTLWR